MIWIGSKIDEDYGWEISALHFIRQFSDGLTFFEFTCNWDKYLDDHTPRFATMLIIFNYKVFEFSIYYLHHRYPEDFDDKYKDHICQINPTSLTSNHITSTPPSTPSETP